LTHLAHPYAIAMALATAALAAPAAQAVTWPDFAQFDTSSSSSTLVLVHALPVAGIDGPAPLLSATATRWADGQAVAVGAVRRWTLATRGSHAARLGLGGGLDHYRSRAVGDDTRRTGASLRAQAEMDGSLSSGAPEVRYYTLAQASSFREGWFLSGQLSMPGAGAGLELSRYGDRGYHATTATLRLPLGAPGWSLRLGTVRDSDGRRAVLGLGWNGF